MIQSTALTITFLWKGKLETRNIDRMHISYAVIKDFYRIPGKLVNYDVYKKGGVWRNSLKDGLSEDLLKVVGAAIEEAERNGTYAPGKAGMF